MSFEELKENYVHSWYDDCKFGGKVVCPDCKIEYGKFPDMLVSDETWKEISPTGNEGGVLCPTCIARRMDYLNLWYTENVFMSKKYYDGLIKRMQKKIIKLRD